MLKIIDLGNGKWGVKEYDEAGNSLGMKEEQFTSESKAQTFIDGLTPSPMPKETPEEAPVNNTSDAPVDNEVDNDAEVAEPESEKIPE